LGSDRPGAHRDREMGRTDVLAGVVPRAPLEAQAVGADRIVSKRKHVAKALAGGRPGTVLDHYTERYGARP
jgi:hypothetical protein